MTQLEMYPNSHILTWTMLRPGQLLMTEEGYNTSDDTYRFFVPMEMITYKLLEVGESKEKIKCEVTRNENVMFLWELITDISDDKLNC